MRALADRPAARDDRGIVRRLATVDPSSGRCRCARGGNGDDERGMPRRGGQLPEGADFEAMVVRLQERLTPGETWTLKRPGFWSTPIWTEPPLSLWLALPFSNQSNNARCEALLASLDVPKAARAEMLLFCAASNQFFSSWNLYVMPIRRGGASQLGRRVCRAGEPRHRSAVARGDDGVAGRQNGDRRGVVSRGDRHEGRARARHSRSRTTRLMTCSAELPSCALAGATPILARRTGADGCSSSSRAPGALPAQ